MLDLELVDDVTLTAIPAALADELAETDPDVSEQQGFVLFNSFI